MVDLCVSSEGGGPHAGGVSPVSGMRAVRAGAVLLTLTLAAPGGQAASEDPQSLVREAFLAARDGLRSGKGRGGYRRYVAEDLRDDVAFQIEFQGDRFELELIHRKRPRSAPPADRQIAISDGSAIFVTSFSERLRPYGSETRVYEAGKISQALPDFRYDLTRLPCQLIRLDEWEKHAPRFEQLAQGGYRCTFDLTERSEATLEFAPEYGYNVLVREERITVGDPRYTRYTASWKQARGVWYMERLLREDWRDGKPRGRIELWYDEFEVNPAVSAERFTLDGLGMPEGSRLVDERPEAPARFHKNVPSVETVQERLDTMIAQAEALPTLSPTPTELERDRAARLAMRLAAAASGVVMLIVTLVVLRRRLFSKVRRP